MKGFYIEVSNNLLDSRHCKQMGDAVWLFMWFIDKVTTITSEKGKVLGGKPIKYEDVKEDLGISRSTYFRWLETLKSGGYITTLRTPYGSCIVITKAKKRFNKKSSDDSNMTHLSTDSVDTDDSNMTHLSSDKKDREVSKVNHPIRSVKSEPSRSVKNGTEMVHNPDISVPNMNHLSPTIEPSNKTVAVDIAVDNSSSVYPSGKKNDKKKKTDEEFTLLVEEDKTGNVTNAAIGLFKEIFPGDFASKKSNPYARKPTREAVDALLERYSLAELNILIQKYDAGKTDPYRPSVGTVYEFCTFKLAKVEAYVSKSSGGLYAQKSISTQEESDVRDKQYQAIIDKAEEESRIAKQEWEKEQEALKNQE